MAKKKIKLELEEIPLKVYKVVDNNKYGDMRGSLEEAATKGRESILSSRAEWTSVDKIMDQNGYTGHVAVTHHNADGSEVIVDYNAQGEKGEEVSPKLDHITFQSGDEVDERNSRVAGSSMDYGSVHGDYAIVLNDQQGANGAGHNALLIGNDDHGYVYLSKDGKHGVSNGDPKAGIGNYKNLSSFINSSQGKKYDRTLSISVSHSSASGIINTMISEVYSNYNVFFNNCTHAVENAFRENNVIDVPTNLVPNLSFDYMQAITNGTLYAR